MLSLRTSVLSAVIAVLLSAPARPETVEVKYRGPVDLKPFVCGDVKSSFVNRVLSLSQIKDAHTDGANRRGRTARIWVQPLELGVTWVRP